VIELGVLLIFLGVAAGVGTGVIFLIVGEMRGAPFVATDKRLLESMFAGIILKPQDTFVDLGSGDGRIVLWAAKKFGCRSVGYEIHPWLVWWSRWKARENKLKKAEFKREDFWKADISLADCVFCYLVPRSMERLGLKLEREGKRGMTVISRAFEIKRWKDKLILRKEVMGKRVYVYTMP